MLKWIFQPFMIFLYLSNIALAEHDYVTERVEKKPHLAGIRIESETPEVDSFHGYTEQGISIVTPEATVHVLLFGLFMDEISQVGFTVTDCGSMLIKIHKTDFIAPTEGSLLLKTQFPATSETYQLCIKQKSRRSVNGRLTKQGFILISDVHTFISTGDPPEHHYFPIPMEIWILVLLIILCGLFSGLTLGLMTLSPHELVLILKSGSKQERKYAELILPVRKSGNFLLCSLLIGNTLVNSAISIIFNDFTSGITALIVSSAAIVLFGEIVPQSVCVKKGLAVGAKTIWLTRFFMVLTAPLAYPIAKLLDKILGDEVVSYDRNRLMELIKLSTIHEEALAEELKIAVGAMEISDKSVADVMTRIEDVFMLPDTTVLDTITVAEILRMGYTRIPVYSGDRNTVVSLLFVKDLALLDPDDNFTIQTVCGYYEHTLRFVFENTPLRVMLEEFKKGDYHLAMVQKNAPNEDSTLELTGAVTLEDIVEEILQAEIMDETDAVTDNVHKLRRRNAQARDLTCCALEYDLASEIISMQMQLVTLQWLMTNQRAFHPDLIDQSILEKIIRHNVRRVEISHLPEMSDPKTVIPKTAKLYSKGEPSEKFILILEGRAMVTIGQNMMTFEAGPWHYFGEDLLNRLMEVVKSTSGTGQQAQKRSLATCKSLPATTIVAASVNSSTAFAESRRTGFAPDFTAVIRDECTYLEISAQTYHLAYKSTLLYRGNSTRASTAIREASDSIKNAEEKN